MSQALWSYSTTVFRHRCATIYLPETPQMFSSVLLNLVSKGKVWTMLQQA